MFKKVFLSPVKVLIFILLINGASLNSSLNGRNLANTVAGSFSAKATI